MVNIMFECKYELIEPIKGKSRKYKANTKRVLLYENGNLCPMCGVPCNIKASDLHDENYEKINFEIAHVYGLRNSANLMYPGMYHIKDINEINSYKNLLLLCKQCHRRYDNPPTYDKYIEMVKVKAGLNQKFEKKTIIGQELSLLWDRVEEIKQLQNLSYENDFAIPTHYIEKIEKNKLSYMKQRSLRQNLLMFNTEIKLFFEDNAPEIGTLILKVNSKIYKDLKNRNIENEEIIDILIKENSNIMSLSSELQTAIVNYCIYVCDVLER